jgi:4-amino-4-deoxy-L-arabinose transferase-like glycosyltransferase
VTTEAFERLPRRIAFGTVLVGTLATATYALSLGSQIRYGDERAYVSLARNVAAGNGYTQFGTGPTAYRPPGYPLVLAMVNFFGMGVVAQRMVSVILLALTAAVAFAFARECYGAWAGTAAAVMTIGYPLSVYTAATLYPQTMAGFLLVSGLFAVHKLSLERGRGRWPWIVTGGLAWGLLIVTVPTFGPALLMSAAWLLKRLGRPGLKTVAVLIAASALIPSAWCVRNAVAMHAFIPVSTNNGINLLQGNSENATMGGGRVVDTSAYEAPVEKAGLSEVQADRTYRGLAVTWIKAHPARATELYLLKVINHFGYHSELATSNQNSMAKDAVAALTFYPILLLGLSRLTMTRRSDRQTIDSLLLTVILSSAFIMAVFYTRLRFRTPLDVVLIIVASGALLQLLARKWPQLLEASPGRALTS